MYIATLMPTLCACILFAVTAFAYAQAPRSPTPKAVEAPVRVTTVAQGFEHPWGLAFLPDGKCSSPSAQAAYASSSKMAVFWKPLAGVPKVFARGQGGLLDVALSPHFQQDRWCISRMPNRARVARHRCSAWPAWHTGA